MSATDPGNIAFNIQLNHTKWPTFGHSDLQKWPFYMGQSNSVSVVGLHFYFWEETKNDKTIHYIKTKEYLQV